jgi:two-component system, chemotaxis family, protein-glutamate methylesterase/glutaminase
MEPGHVYVAPADIHLAFLGNELILQDSEKVQNQKPAVDVLFQSAATAYGSGLLGVLLTGMGRDGADGCVEIVKHGGITIVQDAETSDIFGMPRAAIEQNGATYIEALPNIARFMTELCSNRSRE